VAKFVALGYGVIVPESMAAPANLGLRRREGVALHSWSPEGAKERYWAANAVYDTSCSWDADGGGYPFCYSTSVDNVLLDPAGWKEYYERIYLLRSRELDYFLQHPPAFLHRASRLALLGHSEGAMVASRYHHPALEARLVARVISAWSCEYNYYVGASASASICGGLCDRAGPVLNIIGSEDEYFSSGQSVATRVAEAPGGYGQQPLRGHCLEALRHGGFTAGAVAVMTGAGHDPSLSHDSVLMGVLYEFISPPGGRNLSGIGALSPLCEERELGLYECAATAHNLGMARSGLEIGASGGGAHGSILWHYAPNAAYFVGIFMVIAGMASLVRPRGYMRLRTQALRRRFFRAPHASFRRQAS